MLVKAKCNVSDAMGLHRTGDVWNTDEDLGGLVEVLDAPKPAKAVPEAKSEEPKAKPKSTTRRKVSK